MRAIFLASEPRTGVVAKELARGVGLERLTRVEDAQSLADALRSATWDVVLSDLSFSQFPTASVLAVLRDEDSAVPLIAFADRVGEKAVVRAMRAGARDVVLLEEIERLSEVVKREVAGSRRVSTQHRVIQRNLQNATAFLDSIFENIPLMVFVKDAKDLRFELMNRAGEQLLGRSREELLGKNDHDFFTREQAESFQAKDREALATPTPLEVAEEPISTAQGERWLRTIKIAVRDDEGVPRHLLGISEDITAKRELGQALARAEEKFHQAQKMEALGKLAGGMAHDFNNLLGVIMSYASLVEAALPAGDPLRDDVAEIVRASQRSTELTRQLLAFSRQKVTRLSALDLNEVLGGMEKMVKRLLEESIEVVSTLSPGLWRVLADPAQIEQVLMNLVVNARDAMPRGGKLSLETANVELGEEFVRKHPGVQPGPYVMLAVADTGVGMEGTTLERIFEPFFTTKGVGKGTGLGLSTVNAIVQRGGGMIAVQSEPGRGTTFRVYLPKAAATSERPQTRTPTPLPTLGRGTVLVVEDDEQLLRVVRSILVRSGYAVLAASTPAEAVRLNEEHLGTIELLLTDVIMPQMNGKQLADQITNRRQGLRVAFMSGYTDNVLEDLAALDPSLVLIPKPFTPATLLQGVAEALHREK